MKGDVSHLWASLKQWFATVVLQQGHVQQDADTDGKYGPLATEIETRSPELTRYPHRAVAGHRNVKRTKNRTSRTGQLDQRSGEW